MPDMQDMLPEPPTPFEHLSPEALAYLPDMLKSCLSEDRSQRRAEVRRAWELRLYCRGVQQVHYDDRRYTFLPLTQDNVGFDLPRHRGVYDITSPHRRSFVSILSENPPGINFVPDDLQKGNDVTAAKLAEKMRSRVDRMVAMKDKQARMGGILCTDGRTVSWTRREGNDLKISMYGVLESKVPLFAEDKEEWDYCVLSRETSLWKARSSNLPYKDKIDTTDESNAEGTSERYARLSILGSKSGGDSFKNLVTEHWAWVKPWRYLKAAEKIQAELVALFPNGLRMHAYGSVVVDALPDAMDGLAVEFPVDDEGQSRPALLTGMPTLQNAYNDYRNQQREAADYSVPRTWLHGGAIDGEAIAEQETAYGVVHLITPPSGLTAADCVFVEPAVSVPQEVTNVLPALKQDAEFMTGDFPSLQGAGTPDQDTVGVNRMLHNQAKGQLGPAWAAIKRMFAKIYPVAIRIAAELSEGGNVAIESPNGQESFAPQAILDGSFSCHPDQDSSFPETTADKRASFGQLSSDIAAMGPDGAVILGHPDNLKLRLQYAGIPDFKIPGVDARDKALRLIERSLREQPVPMDGQQAMNTGQPPQMMPSVAINADWDYLQPMVDKVQEWLSSDAAYDAERQGNQAGLQNVMLLGKSIRDALAAQQAQNKPQGPPMGISAAFKDLDSATKVQALTRDGYQPDKQFYDVNTVQAQQGSAAETQKTAADAQHKAVLAARESVSPLHHAAPFKIAPANQGKQGE